MCIRDKQLRLERYLRSSDDDDTSWSTKHTAMTQYMVLTHKWFCEDDGYILYDDVTKIIAISLLYKEK